MLTRLLTSAAALSLTAGMAFAEYKLPILHTNDFHSRFEPINKYDSGCGDEDNAEGKCFGGSARLVTAVTDARARAGNSILVDGGDQFQGSLFYTYYKGKVAAEFMNKLGYNAMTVGNHEFDDGPEVLRGFIDSVDFPVLMSNADIADEELLTDKIKKSTVIEVGGEKIGLIGRSGAGKSTLVKLLLRFYDVEQGAILIDGQDISRVTQDSLRSHIGMVQQDSALLHRSVRDNILYGRPDATEEQMIAAAKQAEAHEFILDLQDPEGRTGYDAHVGERGVKLSGGQRQRVTLARVILKDAPILLLDEATSALDSEVEASIQETLYGMMQGKTVIAIAHRLSTIAQMDRILVMDGGRIVEQGGHSELLAQGGLYAQFWARQSGGFLNPEAAE